MATRKKRPNRPAKAVLRAGGTRHTSGKKISGLDEMRKAREAEIRKSGLTEKEYTRRQELRREMDLLLETGASRDPWATITLAGLHDAAHMAPQVRRKYEGLFQKASEEATQDELGTVIAGLRLLEDFLVAELTESSRQPSRDEFCRMCNLRIERRYLRRGSKDAAGKSVRVNFKSGYVVQRRERAVRSAWELALEIEMSRADFVKHAAKVLSCHTKTIYGYIKGEGDQ